MPGMMRWSCSRGCCQRGERHSEKRAWSREVAEEMSPDIDLEYEYFIRRAEAGLPILGGARLRELS